MLPGTHPSFSGFAATLGGNGVDCSTVTSVNILFNRPLSVKLYVITIIVGMCTTFSLRASPRLSSYSDDFSGLVSLALMMLTIKAAVFRYKIETVVLVLLSPL